jgi:hypothetical protein
MELCLHTTPPQVTMEWCFSMQPQLPTVSDNELWATWDWTHANFWPTLGVAQRWLFSVPQGKDTQNLTPAHQRFLPHLIQFITSHTRQKRISASPICPHASARVPVGGHPQNLKLGPCMKICRENPNSVKTWHFTLGRQKVLLSPATENRRKIILQRHTAPQCKNKRTVAFPWQRFQYWLHCWQRHNKSAIRSFCTGASCYLLARKILEVAPRSYGNFVYPCHIGCFIVQYFVSLIKTTTYVTQQCERNALLRFHGEKDYTNAPQC